MGSVTARPGGAVPLRRRPVDLVFTAFFVVNLLVVTYMIDLEQLVLPPQTGGGSSGRVAWPPDGVIRLVHWWGRHYDPLLMARPPFWRMTIWLDVLFFGPFYLFAIYAFIRGRDWIRVPALVWAGTMSANVLILLMEERYGEYASPDFAVVAAANGPWLLLALATIARMVRDHPFTTVARSGQPHPVPPRLGQPDLLPPHPVAPHPVAPHPVPPQPGPTDPADAG